MFIPQNLEKSPQFHVAESRDQIKITLKWFHWRRFFNSLSVLLLAVFAFLSVTALAEETSEYVFLRFLLVVGIFGIVYMIVACLLNKTQIEVCSFKLKVSHGPLPWPGHKELALSRIRHVFSGEQRRYYRRSFERNFYVSASLLGGGSRVLVKHLHCSSEAIHLERTIEKKLRILKARSAAF